MSGHDERESAGRLLPARPCAPDCTSVPRLPRALTKGRARRPLDAMLQAPGDANPSGSPPSRISRRDAEGLAKNSWKMSTDHDG
ncbi:hypothetical protein SKAU_G00310200 [Synaphobranchus kaupii]|uniref:Uncharacterized protein n=1 Tax=Synaphobranchus kaupii TaxID=118154 RepID=A0A9Q1IK79_SYNKA|nr:hypothetical protein SKAU_G00310200 [Synaphobranchus kaupii]